MSRGHSPWLYIGAQSTIKANPEKRALIHALPDPDEGTWLQADLDADLTRAGLNWLHDLGIIELVETHNGNSGNLWRSTHYVTDLKESYPPLDCGNDGILDSGSDRFITRDDGLECKHCGKITPRERARARANGSDSA